jgi:hypothetical protein
MERREGEHDRRTFLEMTFAIAAGAAGFPGTAPLAAASRDGRVNPEIWEVWSDWLAKSLVEQPSSDFLGRMYQLRSTEGGQIILRRALEKIGSMQPGAVLDHTWLKRGLMDITELESAERDKARKRIFILLHLPGQRIAALLHDKCADPSPK